MNMDRADCLFGGSTCMQGTFFSSKTGNSTSWTGAKKICFFIADSEVVVKEKLTSDILDDNGEPMGFLQLKEAKEFEVLSCCQIHEI